MLGLGSVQCEPGRSIKERGGSRQTGLETQKKASAARLREAVRHDEQVHAGIASQNNQPSTFLIRFENYHQCIYIYIYIHISIQKSIQTTWDISCCRFGSCRWGAAVGAASASSSRKLPKRIVAVDGPRLYLFAVFPGLCLKKVCWENFHRQQSFIVACVHSALGRPSLLFSTCCGERFLVAKVAWCFSATLPSKSSFEAQKRSFSARLPSKMSFEAQKQSFFARLPSKIKL